MKKFLFNDGWQFTCGDLQSRVTLPHDAMQHCGRVPNAPSGNGGAYYIGGVYVYEKEFVLTEKDAQGCVQFWFDGVYRSARVSVNGTELSSLPYGYIPFCCDASAAVRPGKNTVRVEADNSRQPNSRWYSGGGIYRDVWMLTGGKNHILPFGLKITTESIDPATIRVRTAHTGGEISLQIFEDDTLIAEGIGEDALICIENAKLWSAEDPNLYRCKAILKENGVVLDEAEVNFGIRTLHYDTTGFYVNGQHTLLKGGCLHHDNGILGACSIAEFEERRLKILKNAGFNAIRCAHNPASTALLEACDRLGVYVMDELWDMWYRRKNKYDYAPLFPQHWQADVTAMTERDYNHPSVILYSIGNEITEPAYAEGVDMGRQITDLLHRLDPSRPVTVGLNMVLVAMQAMGFGLYDNIDEESPFTHLAEANSTVFNETVSRNQNLLTAALRPDVEQLSVPILDAMDIAGYNYGTLRYPLEKQAHPERVIVGSETYPAELAKTWAVMESCPYIIGDFMWTAWDYIGECSIGCWAWEEDAFAFTKPYPWKLADSGAFDLLGDPTGEAMLAMAVWKGQTHIGVRPVPHPSDTLAKGAWRSTNAIASWSWQGCEGKEAEVEVFTPGAAVELYLNGALVGKETVSDMQVMFRLPYTPGTLEAIAYDENGAECGRDRLVSAAADASWQAICETDAPLAGEVVFYAVQLQDGQGIVESNRDAALTLHISGGELLGFGSAAPRTTAEFHTGHYPSRYGKALAAIRVTDPDALSVHITAE